MKKPASVIVKALALAVFMMTAATAWAGGGKEGIPLDEAIEQSAAEGWLAKAEDVAERTHVVSVACHEAFAALGFKEKDVHRTLAGEPMAQVTVEIFLRGPGELGFRIVYVSGNPHDRANAKEFYYEWIWSFGYFDGRTGRTAGSRRECRWRTVQLWLKLRRRWRNVQLRLKL
jgi:hypothetical protein